MAVVRLGDVIIPEVFNPYMLKETMEKADVFQSGLVVMNDDLSTKLSGGGTTFQSPVWNDLSDTNGSGIGSDNPAQKSTPDKLTAYKMQARRQFRTKSWSTADLVTELAGDKPMDRIVSRVGAWWARDMNRIAIATVNGMINANIANNSGDMVYNVGVGVGTAEPTASMTTGDAEAILDAKQTMGDASDALKIFMMHSVVYTNLQKLQLITFIPNARGEVNIPTYLGYRVIVGDSMPVVRNAANTNFIYTSYLSAPGLIGFGESPPEIPVETDRYPDQGNGTGIEALFTRRQFAMQPVGQNWKETTVAGDFPTNVELELATNWERKFPERKQVPFVAVRSLAG